MSFILNLAKRNNLVSYKYAYSLGAKRKMERTPVLDTEDTINIVKNRRDAILISDEYYPPWVLRQQYSLLKPHDWEFLAFTGQLLPEAYDCPIIFRTLKKQRKLYNFESSIRAHKKEYRRDDKETETYTEEMDDPPEYVFDPEEDSDDEDEDEDWLEDEKESKESKESKEDKDN